MLKKQTIKWIGLGLVAALAFGCASTEPKKEGEAKGSNLGPVVKNPKEKLNEERLKAATKGLDFKGGVVTVTVNRTPDRNAALNLVKLADRSYNVDNVWFEAAGKYRDVILADPSYAPAYIGLAKSVMLEGEVKIAEACYRTAVAKDPNNGQARFELGVIVQGLGDNKGAIAVWKELAQRQPTYPGVHTRLAIASHFDQDYKAAWAYLAEADKRKEQVPPQFRDILKEVAPRP